MGLGRFWINPSQAATSSVQRYLPPFPLGLQVIPRVYVVASGLCQDVLGSEWQISAETFCSKPESTGVDSQPHTALCVFLPRTGPVRGVPNCQWPGTHPRKML